VNGRFLAAKLNQARTAVGRVPPDWVLTPMRLTVTAPLCLALNRGAKNHRKETN
jgi:hypothetical protein